MNYVLLLAGDHHNALLKYALMFDIWKYRLFGKNNMSITSNYIQS